MMSLAFSTLSDGTLPLAVRTTEKPPWRSRPSCGVFPAASVATSAPMAMTTMKISGVATLRLTGGLRLLVVGQLVVSELGHVDHIVLIVLIVRDFSRRLQPAGDGTTRDLELDAVRDLEDGRLLVELEDASVDARAGDDLVAFLERRHERLLRSDSLLLGPDHEEVHGQQQQRQDDETHATPGGRGTREDRDLSGATLQPPHHPQMSSTSARQDPIRPARIASAVRATNWVVQATLWMVTSRAAT